MMSHKVKQTSCKPFSIASNKSNVVCFEPGWFRKCRHLHVSVWHPIIIPESDLDKRGQQFKQNKIHYSVASSPDTVSRQLDPQRTPAGC